MLLALRHLDKNPERSQNYLTGEAQRHVGCHPQLPSSRCHQFREDLSALISLGESGNVCQQLLFQEETPSLSQVTQVLAPRVVGGERPKTRLLSSGNLLYPE